MSDLESTDGRGERRPRPSHEREEPLTVEEKAVLASLQRERAPSEFLRKRVVAALRAEGLLRPGARMPESFERARPQDAVRPPGPRLRPTVGGWAGIIAASVTLFLGGLALGQTIGARRSAEGIVAGKQYEAEVIATWIQHMGSAYVTGLTTLLESGRTGSVPAPEVARGGAVGRAILLAAATELARFDPSDTELAMALEILRTERSEAPTGVVIRTASF